MKLRVLLIFIIAISLAAGSGLWADEKEPEAKKEQKPTFDDMLELKLPGTPNISPDGNWVLYTVRECDMEKNTYRNQIWLVEVKTKKARQMTYAKKSSSGPVWSPDGQSFAFTSAREKKSQIYLMSPFGGEARPITKSKTGVYRFSWSPDGKSIAFTTRDEQSKRDKAIEKKYGKFTEFNEKFNNTDLWILDVKTEKAEKIIDRDDLNVSGFDWSPDSSQIAFSAGPDTRIESYSKTDIYVVTVGDKKIRELVKQTGMDSGPVWSPDGQWIAFNTHMGVDTYFLNTRIAMVPAEGGDIVNLTADFDEEAYLAYWKSKYIWFVSQQRMETHIFALDPKTKKITQFSRQNGRVGYGFTLSRNAQQVAFSYQDARQLRELYVSPVKKYKPLQLTQFGEQVKDWVLGTKEAIKWKSKDGAEITGVLIKPADFDPQKKYPLLVIIHGGPTGISSPTYVDSYGTYYPIEQWLAKGAVIMLPNYRGSAGFGEEFRKLNYRNLGVGDYWDVISGVDYLVSQGFVDENKLGAMGWSQGGYISAFITTFSDRFKATSVGAGISDWVTYYVSTDIPPFTRHYLGATPWDDEEVYKKTSPMTHINKAKTPTLIQHGEFDRRVPIPNAHKLYRGLKDKNVPVKFVIYKGFGHGISKPKEKRAVLKHNWEWFNKYIWGEEPEEETFEDENEKDGEEKKDKEKK